MYTDDEMNQLHKLCHDSRVMVDAIHRFANGQENPGIDELVIEPDAAIAALNALAAAVPEMLDLLGSPNRARPQPKPTNETGVSNG